LDFVLGIAELCGSPWLVWLAARFRNLALSSLHVWHGGRKCSAGHQAWPWRCLVGPAEASKGGGYMHGLQRCFVDLEGDASYGLVGLRDERKYPQLHSA